MAAAPARRNRTHPGRRRPAGGGGARRAGPQKGRIRVTPELVATDVDGTLLDDDETVSPRTREAVRAVVDSGAQFVLATGRPPRWITPIVDQLGFAPMAVCANGA